MLTGMLTNFSNVYSGTRYDSGTGNVTASASGYYRISFFVRFQDTTDNRGIKPTIQGVRWALAGGDNTYWSPTDGASRRCCQWTEINLLTSGQSYNVLMAVTGDLATTLFCMEMISIYNVKSGRLVSKKASLRKPGGVFFLKRPYIERMPQTAWMDLVKRP